MNFKTTFVLLIIFLGIGAYLLFTSGGDRSDDASIREREERVLELASADVTKVSITPAEGEKKVFEKADDGWKLIEPVKARASTWAVDSLVSALTGMKREGRVDRDESEAARAVTEKPQYRIELTTKDGGTKTLAVGAKSLVGNTTYVQVDGRGRIYVVSGSVHDQLSKPVSDFRESDLVTADSQQIRRIELERPEEPAVTLEKQDSTWRITGPSELAAEQSVAQSLASTISMLRAAEFADDQPLGAPRLTVRISTDPEKADSTTVIRFGQWDDILRRNVLAQVNDGPIAKVAAATFDQINKTVLDLRSKDVLKIDPASVQRISLSRTLQATTQPTTRPASEDRLIVRREVQEIVMGPVEPTAQPADEASATQPTTQAATQPSTQPATETVWLAEGGQTVDESRVQRLLQGLNPLRAISYRETEPAENVTGSYELTVATAGSEHRITFVEVGADGLVGTFDGAVFDVPSGVRDAMKDLLTPAE